MDLAFDSSAFVLQSVKVQAAVSVDAGVQTKEVKSRDAGTEPSRQSAGETQTDDGVANDLDLSDLCFDGWAASDPQLQFLRRAAPLIESALADVDFTTDLLAVADEVDDDVGCIQSSAVAFSQPEEAELRKSATSGARTPHEAEPSTAARPRLLGLPCSSVSWNCTGSLLAAGFGSQDHMGWCKHRAGVCVWNLYRQTHIPAVGVVANPAETDAGRSSDAVVGPSADAASPPGANAGVQSASGSSCNHSGVRPSTVLETTSCVCSVAWHPERPGVLAAGTFGGEVLVWDLFREDAGTGGDAGAGGVLIGHSRSDDYFHREPVLRVEWAWDASNSMHVLATASAEGKLLLWQPLESPGGTGLDYPLLGFQPTAVPVQPKAAAGVAEGEGRDGVGAAGRRGDDDSDDERSAGRRRGGGGTKGKASAVVVGIGSFAFALDGRSAAVFYVGAENGGVYKCRGEQQAITGSGGARQLVRAGGIIGAESTLPWEAGAAAAVLRIPLAERPKVVRSIERYARDAGAKVVSVTGVYDARPDPRVLFPNPIAFAYAPHSGAVLALASSPFHRNLFASAGLDGRVCLYSALSAAPLMVLSPSTSARSSHHVSSVTSLAWSKVRPMVFAAASGDGHVYLYDLYAATGRPVVALRTDGAIVSSAGTQLSAPPPPFTLPAVALGEGRAGVGGPSGGIARHGTAGAGFYAVAFNPRQRRLVASGDSDGIVRVFKLGWRMAAPQPSEEILLQRFVESAVSDAVDVRASGLITSSNGGGEAEERAQPSSTGDGDTVNSIARFLRNVAGRGVGRRNSTIASTGNADEPDVRAAADFL